MVEKKITVPCFFHFLHCPPNLFSENRRPKDIAPSIAVGFTINHIAGVVSGCGRIAVDGGLSHSLCIRRGHEHAFPDCCSANQDKSAE